MSVTDGDVPESRITGIQNFGNPELSSVQPIQDSGLKLPESRNTGILKTLLTAALSMPYLPTLRLQPGEYGDCNRKPASNWDL